MNKKQLIVAFILALTTRFAFGESLASSVLTEKTCGEYSIKIYGDSENILNRIEIYKNNKLLFKDEDHSIRIGLTYPEIPEDALVNNCQDITGDGVPDLVISTWSGGAHCCFGFKIFQLGKNFKLIDTIDVEHSDAARFKDIDNDGALEFIGNDWTFAYWNECFAGSPAPSIVLKYKDGKYRLALDLMKKPLPSKEEENKVMQEIQNRLKQLREDTAEERKKPYAGMDLRVGADTGYFGWIKNGVIVPAPVWGHMLDLIYTGHPKEAWIFLDKIMPGNSLEKKQFIADFRKQLSESPYWDSIKVIIEKNE